jgi:hypothetical protein
MEVAGRSETLVCVHKATRCHILESSDLDEGPYLPETISSEEIREPGR